jgi:hypothetical protein
MEKRLAERKAVGELKKKLDELRKRRVKLDALCKQLELLTDETEERMKIFLKKLAGR